jgi:hypothetical protein
VILFKLRSRPNIIKSNSCSIYCAALRVLIIQSVKLWNTRRTTKIQFIHVHKFSFRDKFQTSLGSTKWTMRIPPERETDHLPDLVKNVQIARSLTSIILYYFILHNAVNQHREIGRFVSVHVRNNLLRISAYKAYTFRLTEQKAPLLFQACLFYLLPHYSYQSRYLDPLKANIRRSTNSDELQWVAAELYYPLTRSVYCYCAKEKELRES